MRASVNGIEIAYTDDGEGAPVLLLTGLGGAGKAWGEHRARFSTEFRAIIPDHRGTGDSTAADSGYTIGAHATDMAELLRHLGSGPVHVVGSSTGGAIGQVMALDHPDVVRSLTLVSSWAGPDDYFRREFLLRRKVLVELGSDAYREASTLFLFAPTYTARRPDAVAAWAEKTSRGGAPDEIMVHRIDMILAHDVRDRLGNIRVPTMVLVGDEDICTPPYLSRELAEGIPGAELVVVDGGHLIYNEKPDEFFETVASFLRNH